MQIDFYCDDCGMPGTEHTTTESGNTFCPSPIDEEVDSPTREQLFAADTAGDLYEDDEPIGKIAAAFNRGMQGNTEVVFSDKRD